MEKHLLSENIRSLADSIGIDAVGFAEAFEFTNYALNHHQRRDPKLTLPNAKSIIVAGIYNVLIAMERAEKLTERTNQ
jgi:epoxyqueuosine reductase QueG